MSNVFRLNECTHENTQLCRDTVKTYLSPKRTPDEKSKRTPVKSQNVLPQNVPPIVNQSVFILYK